MVQTIFLLCVSLTCPVHSPCSGTGLSDVAKTYPACHHFTSLHFRDADNVAIWLIHDFRKYYYAFNFLRKKYTVTYGTQIVPHLHSLRSWSSIYRFIELHDLREGLQLGPMLNRLNLISLIATDFL